jgi:thioredoxin reductase/protein-L-isoaspartate O-methyltransferase
MLADSTWVGKVGDMNVENTEWDCVVVGGGAAGLSTALVLGRARRRTLVVDAGEQSNLPAHGIGGLLGYDGRPPAELYDAGRAELATYPSVEFRRGEVVTGRSDGGGFALELADGVRVRARKVVLATGMDYRMPSVPGLSELWGRSAFHCPFCHGWEMRDQPLAILASGERAVHMGLMLRGWTDDIVVLTNGATGPDEGQQQQLTAAGVRVDDRAIAEFVSEAGELVAVRFSDGVRLARRGVLVASSLHQRSPLAAHLGVAIAAPGPVVEDAVQIDQFHRTSVPGVFAAGDLSVQMPQVAAAIATGSLTGAAVVQSLLADDFGLPVPPWPANEAQQYWESHYGERDRIWSGRVNVQLAAIVAGLPTGRALDLGCGEGGDAVWLAEHGWQVKAVDISETAIGRAAAEAGTRGVRDRIAFERHDLSDSFPAGTFDLISAQFLHSTERLERPQILRRAADAVALGGVLVIVDHAAPPPFSKKVPHDHPFPSPQEVLAELNLPAAQWEQERVEQVDRAGTDPDGQPFTWRDNVMVLRRRN